VTRLDALRRLLASPRVEPDLGRIGRRVLYAHPDGRERLAYVVRVLRTVLRRAA